MLHPELNSPDTECSIAILPPHYPAIPLPCYLDPSIPYTAVHLSHCPILQPSHCPTLQPFCYSTIQLSHCELFFISRCPANPLTIQLFHHPTTQLSHNRPIPLTPYPVTLHPEPDSPDPEYGIGMLPPTILLGHYPAVWILTTPIPLSYYPPCPVL